MLICWPGIESSMKRAATSETRCAPDVTTTILDDDQDEEDDEADDEIALDREGADRIDDVAGIGAGQDEPGRRDVEREPEQGRDQQQRREGREFDRLADVEGQQQDRERRSRN